MLARTVQGLEILQCEVGKECLIGANGDAAFDFTEKMQVDLVGNVFRQGDVAEDAGDGLFRSWHRGSLKV